MEVAYGLPTKRTVQNMGGEGCHRHALKVCLYLHLSHSQPFLGCVWLELASASLTLFGSGFRTKLQCAGGVAFGHVKGELPSLPTHNELCMYP